MKCYDNLFEQVVNFRNLMLAARKAFKGKKEKKGVADFYFHLEKEVLSLEKELRFQTYMPSPLSSFEIFEPKRRNISAAVFKDRVVHHAICNIIEPIFNQSMIFDTYACRTDKGSHAAVKRCQHFSQHFEWFLKCDIEKYFETINHEMLKQILRKKIEDVRIITLLDKIIDHPVPGGVKGRGIPIGNLTSQLFANIYLGTLDHLIKDQMGIKGYLRYMDDFILFSRDKESLHNVLHQMRMFLEEKLFLKLKPSALKLAPVYTGVPFLGFRIYPGLVRLNRESLKKFRAGFKKREKAYECGEIDHDRFMRGIRSMTAHISHADSYRLRGSVFG